MFLICKTVDWLCTSLLSNLCCINLVILGLSLAFWDLNTGVLKRKKKRRTGAKWSDKYMYVYMSLMPRI